METEIKPDNFSTKDYWILITDENICITKQTEGFEAEGGIVVPKKDFDKLIEFYNKNNAL